MGEGGGEYARWLRSLLCHSCRYSDYTYAHAHVTYVPAVLPPCRYNDTYARIHVPPVPLPLPRNFSVVYLESGTMRSMVGVSESLSPVRPNDVLVINMGAHYRCAA